GPEQQGQGWEGEAANVAPSKLALWRSQRWLPPLPEIHYPLPRPVRPAPRARSACPRSTRSWPGCPTSARRAVCVTPWGPSWGWPVPRCSVGRGVARRAQRAPADWGRNYDPELMRRLGFTHAKTPCPSTLHTVFRHLDWQALEAELRGWS